MLFRCAACGNLYADETESADALCQYCRQKAKSAAETRSQQAHKEPDWRDPLYDYACYLAGRKRPEEWQQLEEILIRLGDFRDCAQLLEKTRTRMRDICALSAEDIQTSDLRSVIERAVICLRALSDMPEARAALAAGEEKLRLILEREEREKQKALRRKTMRKRICLACGTIAAAALVLWTVVYVKVIFPGRLDQAEVLIAQGRHEEAIALCLKSESVRKTLRGGELLYAAQAGSAQAMRAEGRFEEAADLYALLDLTDKLDETYVQWSDALAAQGNAREAIRVLLLAQESEPREERLAALYMDRAEQAAQEAIVRGTQDTDYARESGKEIPTLDAQLRYCHALFDAGFDLLAVYPDGVKVEDAKLAQFQIDAPNVREAELDLDDALIFARTEIGENNSIPWLTYTLTTSEAHDRTQDSLYMVHLLPGHMFREGASPVHSRAQADTVLLMDGVYAELGMVSVWDHLKLNDKDYIGIPVFMHYPYFGAISSVAAYDLRDPSRRQVFASETSLPLCSDEAWMAEHENDARTLSDLNVRMGTLNMQAMRSALDELLFGGKHAGRKDEAASTKEGRDANGTGA